ncbi:disease resistance protein Pik-2-like [Miscanthus floridulus]|uniref:disease resistance protein Pik-2-like n=1 Tax=Miscanthus floridulus TaxID=154761 RepID=UPI00345A8A5E
MADLVFGLAKTAVNATLCMAKSAIEEEKKLKKSVQRDLMLISDEFEMMHAFLNVVSNERAKGDDDMSRTWVRQVRDMALDVEDRIECVLQLDDNKPSYWWRNLLPSCVLLPQEPGAAALGDAVAGIELLKARIEAVGPRNTRYIQIQQIGDAAACKCQCKPVAVGELLHQQALADSTTESDILFEARNSAKICPVDLVKLIVDNKEQALRVVSIWGTTGDLGTTSIIRTACDDTEIFSNFGSRAWVKVPRPFSPHEFLRRLLTQLYTNRCLQQQGSRSTADVLKKMEAMSSSSAPQGGGLLVDELMMQLGDERYLVILEDVSTMVEWDTIRAYLPDRNNGSCIVVHTQQAEIAGLCVGHSHRVCELDQFSADHSVCVFFNKDEDKGEKTTKKKAAKDWLDKFQLVGRQTDLHLIDSYAQSNAGVSSVWGIAGVGKSSLVKHLYCERIVKGQGFEKFGWVNVTHPFSLRDLLRSLLMDLYSETFQHSSISRIKDPIQECSKIVRKYRSFIVIDGLQSTEEWDLIKTALTYGPSTSHIIIITNDKSVATYCTAANQAVWNVKGLEMDEAIDLFKMKLCSDSLDRSPEVEEQAKLILHKCGGLPKVIVAIAEHVQDLPKPNLEFFSSLNSGFMKTLEAMDNPMVASLFAWVHSYFHSCPDVLKPCMFYLSIFPAKQSIRWRRLVRRWIAEGYSSDTKDSTAEETAKKLLSQLVELSIIQPLEASSSTSSFLEATTASCQVNEDGTSPVGSTWDLDRALFDSIDFSRLRSLTVFGKWRPFFVSAKMSLLRVLDLEDASGVTDKDLEQMLQTLDVRNTAVLALPSDITKLQKLRYIHAGSTTTSGDDDAMVASSKTAGEQLTKGSSTPAAAASSRQRDFTCCLSRFLFRSQLQADAGGVVVPRKIGNLSALHTLGVININSITGGELKKLTQLHKLGVCGVNRANSQELCSFVSGHGHLESLSVRLDNKANQDGCLDGVFPPPENLRSLKLHGLAGKLPVWIKDLWNLRKLNLQMAMLDQDGVDVLGNLPWLSTLSLCLKTLRQDGELHFRTDFRGLVVLEIACNSKLKVVEFNTVFGGGLGNIELLKIHCCNVTSLQFPGLELLRSIKEVYLRGSYGDELKLHLQSQIAKQEKEIEPVFKEQPNK